MIILKTKISFLRVNKNEDINSFYCDSKNLFYKIMLILAVLCVIVIFESFYYEITNFGIKLNFENIVSLLLLILILLIPCIYLIMKFINFKFYEVNGFLFYKNIYGKKFNYLITDIKNVKRYSGNLRYKKIIIIEFQDKKIIVSWLDRGFDNLEKFLIKNNLLKR